MSDERKLKTEWFDRVEQRPIEWLWRPWFARGVITVVDGVQGVGKSSLLFDVIARVTTGGAFPQFDQASDVRPTQAGDVGRAEPRGEPGEISQPGLGRAGDVAAERGPGKVLLLALQDPVVSVVAPRLAAAGADLANVAGLRKTEHTGGDGPPRQSALQLPRDLDLLVSECREARPRLVVIDSLSAALGKDENDRPFKANDETGMRRLFGSLKDIAEEYQTAMVVIRRLDDAAGAPARRRGGPGAAGPIPDQARCGLLVAADPLEPEGSVLSMVKSNLEAAPRSIRFEASGAPIRWVGPSDLTADELARAGDGEKGTEAQENARYFLKTTLFEPRPFTWAELTALAAKEHIPEITLRRERRKLKLVKTSKGRTGFYWSLPPKLLDQMHREARRYGWQDPNS